MYAIICFDRKDSAALRDKHRAGHQDFLKKNEKKILYGGPLKDLPDGPSTGALIVVDCKTKEEAEAFIGADPFKQGGVYETVSVRAFKKVFPQG